jgi:ArsR family transcriptional regulator, lead/cadmium/zinc/bismuth-responsive transcriptional repressor
LFDVMSVDADGGRAEEVKPLGVLLRGDLDELQVDFEACFCGDTLDQVAGCAVVRTAVEIEKFDNRSGHELRVPLETSQRMLGCTMVADDRCELLALDLPKAEALRAGRPSEWEAHLLAEGYRALGDPTRLTLTLALRDGGELCVCDLAWIAERAENLVSHHLRVLRAAGLADYRRAGKMALYSLTPSGHALLDALPEAAVVE